MAGLLEPFAGRRAEAAAERLIAQYGGLGRALLAPRESLEATLTEHPGLAARLVAARSLFEASLREHICRTAISATDPDYLRFLRFTIGKSPVECLHATFVTSEWGYLADDRVSMGGTTQVDVNLRTLLSRAFDVGAHGVVLAHNHPSGSAEPSEADIAMTGRVARITQSVGIELLDHLIVGADAVVSMRERGLL